MRKGRSNKSLIAKLDVCMRRLRVVWLGFDYCHVQFMCIKLLDILLKIQKFSLII